ncbi:GDP-mannose 4,6-dehydratase [Temperatibacter marinus]|uniref:GDP-mannose 4,6-dehydratase n=1 Tax=Temperatibacter marinus TaxID=1456591 RepID=A0AA52EGP8_9PROT|nr:NAD-dependent epimerase/dehydratase family protein [Temperatibacter marinus]WND02009.1 GDP-mannose 4,6-dehydratase [Temperatibacter marinus]
MSILVTGAAGFIGYHLTLKLMSEGHEVIGIDNLNDYYDPALKKTRLKSLTEQDHDHKFTFKELDISDEYALQSLGKGHQFSHIYHLAAQAGVRYSLTNPQAYTQSNLVGHVNMLELARHQKELKHFIYASSSSIYGDSTTAPFQEDRMTEQPKSLYAATKKSNELLTQSYSHLYGIAATGLRFFTVYGPYGRPDMAPWLFTDAILAGRPIKVFNQGDLRRDFTYVADIVDGCFRLLNRPPENSLQSIFNIGHNQPVQLMTFIETLEHILGLEAEKIMMPMQPGDVYETSADITKINKHTGFKPKTSLTEGLTNFVTWFKEYHQ